MNGNIYKQNFSLKICVGQRNVLKVSLRGVFRFLPNIYDEVVL